MAEVKCFVIRPFGEAFDPVCRAVQEAVSHALPGQEIRCHWLKDVAAAGRITDDIISSLQEATLCVADVTGANPNVMWETGYAMAMGKPTILIGQRVDALPFDLRVHRVQPYSADALPELLPRLAEAVRQTLAKYDVEPGPRPDLRLEGGAQTIVVTGTSRADRARTQRRLGVLLSPRLGAGAVWYCGSTGTVDECALEYLVERGERVVAVAYHRYDFSEGVRELVLAGKVAYLDASVEPVPRGVPGPTEREVFFCTKADLVALFWDGVSVGTGRLLRYFQDSGKNLLVGFI